MFKRRDVPFFPVMGTSLRPGIWPKVLIGLMLLWRASSAVAGLNPAEIVDPRFADEALGPGLRRAAKRTFASAEPARADDRNRMAMYVRLDNDSFAGSDRGYTNGIRIGFTSPTVASFDDSRLPAPLRWLDRRLAWMQPRGFEDYNVTLAIGQGMFTPEDRRPRVPDPLDRPYAGVLVASVTYNGRDAHSMHSTTLELGLVGPSTLAEQTQDFVHDRLGSDEFRGWDHQLRDEPVARIIHQRLRKRVLAARAGDGRCDRSLRRQHRQSGDVRQRRRRASLRPHAAGQLRHGAKPARGGEHRALADAALRDESRSTDTSRSMRSTCSTTSRSTATPGGTARAWRERNSSPTRVLVWRCTGADGSSLSRATFAPRSSRHRGRIRSSAASRFGASLPVGEPRISWTPLGGR